MFQNDYITSAENVHLEKTILTIYSQVLVTLANPECHCQHGFTAFIVMHMQEVIV